MEISLLPSISPKLLNEWQKISKPQHFFFDAQIPFYFVIDFSSAFGTGFHWETESREKNRCRSPDFDAEIELTSAIIRG